MTTPDGRTPADPDNDTLEDDAHASSGDDAGRTPSAPDQAEGDDPTAG